MGKNIFVYYSVVILGVLKITLVESNKHVYQSEKITLKLEKFELNLVNV